MNIRNNFKYFILLLLLAIYPVWSIMNKNTSDKNTSYVYEENTDIGDFKLVEQEDNQLNVLNEENDYVVASNFRKIDESKNDSLKREILTTEVLLSTEQLIDDSILIVRGKITEKLGEYDYEGLTNEYGEYPKHLRSLYDFESTEVLKGEQLENITISFYDSYFYDSLELNKEYVFCLYHLVGDYKNAYSILGSQGILEIKDNEIIKNTGKAYTLEDFINEIDKVMEKNEKGIPIKKVVDLKLN